MTRSPTEIIARAVHDNDRAYAPPYWDDCYPEMQRFYLEMGDKALSALADAGWSLYRPDECATTKASGRRGGGRRSESRFYLVPVEGEN